MSDRVCQDIFCPLGLFGLFLLLRHHFFLLLKGVGAE